MIEIKFSGASVDEVVGDLVNFTGAILQKDLGLVRKDPNETNELWTSGAEVDLPWEDPEADKPKTNTVIAAEDKPAKEEVSDEPKDEKKSDPEPESETVEPAEGTETIISFIELKDAMLQALRDDKGMVLPDKKAKVKEILAQHNIEKLPQAQESQRASLFTAFKELT